MSARRNPNINIDVEELKDCKEKPFFSIVSVCYKDVWALSKTARSVFRQQFKNFEYIIVDGDSCDGTEGLIDFWTSQGLVSKAIIEPDQGVYDAMNKALRHASGEYTCFLNAGDLFYADDVLSRVHNFLNANSVDGVLGWGELNGQLWSSWIESAAFRMASLGFCHQALYAKTELLRKYPFDSRPFKTDSDTLQLGSLYAANARIPVVAEPLAERGGEPGISANLDKTRYSILDTLTSQYPQLNKAEADSILRFRRRAEAPEEVLRLLDENTGTELSRDLALTILDTLFLRQSKCLPSEMVSRLLLRAKVVLDTNDAVSPDWHRRLKKAQEKRLRHLHRSREAADALKKEICQFETEELGRFTRLDLNKDRPPSKGYVISLTSFPPRLATLHFVIQTLVNQSYPPGRIELWLGKDEVPSKRWLSKKLLAFEERGLEVKFCKRTCLQYDKFLHNSELNRKQRFVIVDDDVIYPPQSMQALLDYSQRFPNSIIGNRVHEIGLGKSGEVLPYEDWRKEVLFSQPSHRAFPTGAGGVLYPVGCLSDPAVTNVDQIVRIAPYADDIWLKVYSILRNRKAVSTHLSQKGRWYHRYTPTMTAGSLHSTNVALALNDRQIWAAVKWLNYHGIALDQVLQKEVSACL